MKMYSGCIENTKIKFSKQVISLLYSKEEELAKDMANQVGKLCEEMKDSEIINQIIHELTEGIYHSDSSQEGSGIKNACKFLERLSKAQPKEVYRNISKLLGFFDCESFVLRIALIKILSNVIRYVLTIKDSDDRHSAETRLNYAKTKDLFIELLVRRINDKTATCRTKVLKQFIKLYKEGVMPVDNCQQILAISISRLKDTGHHVRKYALKVLKSMLIIGLEIYANQEEEFMDLKTLYELEEVASQEMAAFKDQMA